MNAHSHYYGRPNALLLAEDRVAAAERLLLAHAPIKRVCRELRLNRETVRKIKAGKHPLQVAGQQKKRCPGCGGQQKFPCRVCAARKVRPSAA